MKKLILSVAVLIGATVTLNQDKNSTNNETVTVPSKPEQKEMMINK